MSIRQFSIPSAQSLNLAEMVQRSLYGFNARVAAPASGTSAPVAPVRALPAPPIVNDEVAIARGHAERRAMLAQRRAEQQLRLLLIEAQHSGTSLTVEAMAGVVITAYTDTLAVARR